MTTKPEWITLAKKYGHRVACREILWDEETARDYLDQATGGDADTTELDILVATAFHWTIRQRWGLPPSA